LFRINAKIKIKSIITRCNLIIYTVAGPVLWVYRQKPSFPVLAHRLRHVISPVALFKGVLVQKRPHLDGRKVEDYHESVDNQEEAYGNGEGKGYDSGYHIEKV